MPYTSGSGRAGALKRLQAEDWTDIAAPGEPRPVGAVPAAGPRG